MDGSDSPGTDPQPPSDGRADSASSEEPQRPGLLSRIIQTASGALSVSNPVDDEGRGLGPAFQNCSQAEQIMVGNILRLRDLRVEDVMIPRADIVAVSEEAGLDEVIAAFKRGSFSRLPVFRETLDDPIGFVHLKDLALDYWLENGHAREKFNLAEHIHTALFVPASMRIVALLQRMQGARVHMALVIDEFGGVDGLVTIEDLVEQIVGDIDDEHDEEDAKQWTPEGAGVYVIDARADIRDFEEATGVRLLGEDWEEEVDTLGGLVFMLANRVPSRGEVIAHPFGHEFQVTDADARRIKRLRLTLNGAGNGSDPVAMRQAAE